MIDEIGRQLVISGLLPHGYCINWSPALLGTYVVSDIVIVLSYFSMPLAVIHFARRRPDFPYRWLLWMIATFVIACGLTHLMGVVILWQPMYWLDAGLKMLTAVASLVTAIALWPLVPRALKVPSTTQLQAVNEELRREIAQRERIERELRLANEALLKSNLDLQHFAHAAAHDLQNPLRSVSTFTHLLRRRLEDRADPEAQKLMGQIGDGAARMQMLIDDLLAYTRLDSQARPLEPTDCRRVFEEAKANLDHTIREKGAVVSSGELPQIRADRTQLAQLLQNLIENGLKYNASPAPRVDVEAARREGEWLFSVRDNGIGISPKYHQRIFEIFRRLHTQSEFPGTGIGLAICQKVVERHGGRLWVESAEGAGSTFYFTVPEEAVAAGDDPSAISLQAASVS